MGGWFGAGAPGPADSLSLGSEPKECGLTTLEGGCPDGLSWYSTPLRLWPTLTATRSIIATLFGTGAHAATRPTLRCALRLRPKYAVDSRVAYSGRRHDYVVSSHPNRPCNNSPQHTPWWWLSRMVVDSLPIWAVQEATLGGGSGGGDSGPPYGAVPGGGVRGAGVPAGGFYLSRLGELLNTQQNVTFSGPRKSGAENATPDLGRPGRQSALAGTPQIPMKTFVSAPQNPRFRPFWQVPPGPPILADFRGAPARPGGRPRPGKFPGARGGRGGGAGTPDFGGCREGRFWPRFWGCPEGRFWPHFVGGPERRFCELSEMLPNRPATVVASDGVGHRRPTRQPHDGEPCACRVSVSDSRRRW